MRFLVQVSIPTYKGNELVEEGKLPETVSQILDELKPEAAYFTANEGLRGGFLVVNLENASEIPKVAEPFFLAFDAEVRFEPTMLPEDLMKAGDHLKAATKNYS